MDATKSIVAEPIAEPNAEPSSRFLFRDASEREGKRVGERLGELLAWDCDCNCDCDRVGELEAESGGTGLRKTYAKGSNGVASGGFMDKSDDGCDMG